METAGQSRHEEGPSEGRGGNTPEWCLRGRLEQTHGLAKAGEGWREASCLLGLGFSMETTSNTTQHPRAGRMQGAQLCQPVSGIRVIRAEPSTGLSGLATGEERAKWS